MAGQNLKKGIFITFEGFEGSGKSTQIKLLEDYLKKHKYPVLVLREPGSTRVSEAIRRMLLDKNNGFISDKTELLFYLAARAQLVEEKIVPALKKGAIILCDRFQDATVAYQGYGLGLERAFINQSGSFVTGGLTADLTVLLDIDVGEGLRRAGKNKDRIEQRSFAYHLRVRKGYLKIAQSSPRRVKVVKVKNIKKTHEEIKRLVDKLLNCKCHLKK
ncbi:MAG: dTMP kinase [Omnitrophica WOR_2 bacterium RIFCSPHIGHO2_02_FULL_45_21]|nr:MAG: dTMP kinase [Omnitrophica WOR_2 bacterium RIFCSPHIGHO2_02_FULL_45_21]